MRRTFLLVTALLLAAPGAPAAPANHVTYFGESLLSRCALVVRARVQSRTVLQGGMTLTTFRIEETLMGRYSGRRLVLGSPDPRYLGVKDREFMLFLARTEGEGERGFRVVERFFTDDETGPKRARMASEYIRCEAIADPRERRSETRRLHIENASGDDAWTRANAIRELSWFTKRWASTFTRPERDRLFALRDRIRDRALRKLLTQALHLIDKAVAKAATVEPRPGVPDREKPYLAALAAIRNEPSGPARALKIDVLSRRRPARVGRDLVPFLEDAAPEVRRMAVHHLAETETRAAGSALLAVLGREKEDEGVRRDVIRSLGILRFRAAVPAISKILMKLRPGQSEVAIQALARIGTPDAKAALAACRKLLTGDGKREATLRRSLDFVASEGFVKQERILTRIRRNRLAADR